MTSLISAQLRNGRICSNPRSGASISDSSTRCRNLSTGVSSGPSLITGLSLSFVSLAFPLANLDCAVYLDGRFVVVVSEKVTLPPLDLGSIQLVDSSSPSCSPVTSLSTFVVYQFPVSSCGSTVQLAGGNVTYQNTMSAAITVRSGPEGSITRDSVYKLFFQCTYSGSQDVQVEAEVYTVRHLFQ
ncbi:zona pellucida sperm-binding protein 4-like [Polypterus senegalus]|uniref:zona pellucida sperm-binding protein 4-like n=1 Tax=Polypterus senegalus TaxID=55291 RepID=UPI0019663F29|nr:zona pellucida sperm-binding protein 4-like [Polypterus senegalus]